MEVAEGNHCRDELDVLRELTEVRDDLDNLGEENPGDKGNESSVASVAVVGRHTVVEESQETAVDEEGRSLELTNVDGVERPDVSVVPVSCSLHDTEVTSPVTTSPAHALVQEHLRLSLEGGHDAGVGVELKSDLEALVINPSSEVLVVIMVGSVEEE